MAKIYPKFKAMVVQGKSDFKEKPEYYYLKVTLEKTVDLFYEIAKIAAKKMTTNGEQYE